MKISILLATLIAVFAFAACNKTSGEGGTSTISGKVYVVDLNGTGDTVEQYYAPDVDVYVIYGDEDQTYDNDFATSLDGSYRFDYLTPGTYTVFAYSKCDGCAGGVEAIQKTVEISTGKQAVEVEDLIIID